jgi:hypothetical protein
MAFEDFMNDRRNARQNRVRELVGVLDMVQANWSRPRGWTESAIDVWLKSFDGVPIEHLRRAVRYLIETGAKSVQVHDVRAALQSVGYTQARAEGCDNCQNSGVRELARHYKKGGKTEAVTVTGACDCALGRRYQKSIRQWRETIDDWQRNPATVSAFYTDSSRQKLTYFERYARTEPWLDGAKPSATGWVYPSDEEPELEVDVEDDLPF